MSGAHIRKNRRKKTQRQRVQEAKRHSSLYLPQTAIDRTERFRTGLRFGDIEAPQLGAILRSKERGELRDWADLCEYMLKSDDHMAGEFQTRINRVAQLDWTLQPGPTSDPAKKQLAQDAVDFITEAIDYIQAGDRVVGDDGGIDPLELSFHGLTNSCLHALGSSAQPAEIIWYVRGNTNYISHFEYRHLRNFRWDDNFRLRYYGNGEYGPQGEELAPNKWIIHFDYDSNGYPTRAGILEPLVWRWWLRKLSLKWWAGSLEQFGKTWLHGKVPPNTTPEVRRQFQQALENLASNQVAVTDQTVEILARGGEKENGHGQAFKIWEEVNDAAISKRILGVSDASGPGENGARAAVDSRIASAMDPRARADAKHWGATLRRDLFRALLAANTHKFGGRMPPVPVWQPVFHDDNQELSDQSINAGAVSINEIREADGLAPLEGEKYNKPLYEIRERVEDTPTPEAQPTTPPALDLPSTDPTPGPSAPDESKPAEATENVQQAALNGAQITSLLEVVERVASGQIPRDTGIALITASFPISESKAEQIMGTVGTESFKPRTKDEDDKAPAGGQDTDVPLELSANTVDHICCSAHEGGDFADFYALSESDQESARARIGRPAEKILRATAQAIEPLAPLHEAITKAVSNAPDPDSAKQAIQDAIDSYDAEAITRHLYEAEVHTDLAGQIMVHEYELGLKVHELQADDPPPFLSQTFTEALDAFRQRGIIDERELSTLLQDYRGHSEQARNLLLDHLRKTSIDGIDRALSEGTTFTEYRRAMQERGAQLGITIDDHGYLENVFRTNLATAYGAGRERSITDPIVQATRPYWQYRTADDGPRVRPNHQALHMQVFETGNPATDGLRPPNGYSCRCSAVTLSREEAEGLTIHITVPDGGDPDPGWFRTPTQQVGEDF